MSAMEKMMREFEVHGDMFAAAGMTREHVQRIGEEALLTVWDMLVIFRHVRRIPDGGTYLEIGSHLGGSLRCAWEAAGDRIKYRSIDPFVYGLNYGIEWEPKFRKNTAHIPTDHIQEYSHLVADRIPDGSVDVLLVDGDHTYSPAKKDFLLYWRKLKAGGVLLAHDFNYSPDHEGVVRAVLEVFTLQRIVRPFRSSMAVIVKEPGNEGLWVYGDRYGVPV